MKPFKSAHFDPVDESFVEEVAKRSGISKNKAREHIEESLRGEVWVNDLYQVIKRDADNVLEGWPEMYWLSIKRLDKKPIHDWRDLQLIKNMLVGGDNEAVELYPAEARLTDTANQFHLWVLKKPGLLFPFGFKTRVVTEETLPNGKQRPFN